MADERRTRAATRKRKAEAALQIARGGTAEGLRQDLRAMILDAWRMAAGHRQAFSVPEPELSRLSSHLLQALELVESSAIVARPDLIAQCEASLAAASDATLQAMLEQLVDKG